MASAHSTESWFHRAIPYAPYVPDKILADGRGVTYKPSCQTRPKDMNLWRRVMGSSCFELVGIFLNIYWYRFNRLSWNDGTNAPESLQKLFKEDIMNHEVNLVEFYKRYLVRTNVLNVREAEIINFKAADKRDLHQFCCWLEQTAIIGNKNPTCIMNVLYNGDTHDKDYSYFQASISLCYNPTTIQMVQMHNSIASFAAKTTPSIQDAYRPGAHDTQKRYYPG